MKKNKITVFNGFGKLSEKNIVNVVNDKNEEKKLRGENIIIATGARSRDLTNIKQDGKHVIGYR